jgi:hypothetical protein
VVPVDSCDGVGVAEIPEFDDFLFSECRVIFEPGSEEAMEVVNSLVKNPHSAAESWDGRPEFGNEY